MISTFSFLADGNKCSFNVTLEPVSCRQRFLRAPVDVVLRGVLQDLDTISLSHSASESWIIQCTDAELGQEAFQHLKQLSTGGSAMVKLSVLLFYNRMIPAVKYDCSHMQCCFVIAKIYRHLYIYTHVLHIYAFGPYKVVDP